MTRSKATISPRDAFTKTIRAKAQFEDTNFREAMERTKAAALLSGVKVEKPATSRRNPGRMHGTTWNSDAFVCEVDDSDESLGEIWEVYVPDFDDATRDSCHVQPITISLMDIARPAKAKGVAKDFEVVQGVRRVIALEDSEIDATEQWEDDWEELCDDERRVHERQSYSAVLRGDEG